MNDYPQDYLNHYKLGKLLYRAGYYYQAIESLKKAQGLASEDIPVRDLLERAAAAAIALHSDRDNLVTTLSIRTMNPKIRIVVKEIEPGMASRFRRAGAGC